MTLLTQNLTSRCKSCPTTLQTFASAYFSRITNFAYAGTCIRLGANGRNIVADQQLPTLLDVTCSVSLHTLLHVVKCCCVLLRKVWSRSNFSAKNTQHFFCSVIATLLGPRTLIMHGLQLLLDPFAQLLQYCWGYARSLRMVYKDLRVVSFPRCTVGPNIFWELLHPFALHWPHGRNNSQHCWRNNVRSSKKINGKGGEQRGF